jgi:hypothetical protein
MPKEYRTLVRTIRINNVSSTSCSLGNKCCQYLNLGYSMTASHCRLYECVISYCNKQPQRPQQCIEDDISDLDEPSPE